MDTPLDHAADASNCRHCGAELTTEDRLKCAALREKDTLCVACLEKAAALRTAAAAHGFKIGL